MISIPYFKTLTKVMFSNLRDTKTTNLSVIQQAVGVVALLQEEHDDAEVVL